MKALPLEKLFKLVAEGFKSRSITSSFTFLTCGLQPESEHKLRHFRYGIY
jgi:hypothetical protein